MLIFKTQKNKTTLLKSLPLALLIFIGNINLGFGQTAIYTVSTTSAVTTSGTAPSGSSATYAQTYTPTVGQMTSSNSTTLTLSGYAGMRITQIVLRMKSNSSKGAGKLSVVAGSTSIASISPTKKFNTAEWYGAWSTSYVNVTKTPTAYNIGSGENVVITIAATENSIYIESYEITYEPIVIGPSYEISFNANGGTGSMSNQPIVSGASTNLNTNTFSRSGYTFSGWSTSASGPVYYLDGDSFTMGTANVTLYAQWAASYNITFDANGGTGSMSNQPIVSGTSATLNTNTFSRSGYTFSGWSTSASGPIHYLDGDSFTMGSVNVTLYAQWVVYVGPCHEEGMSSIGNSNSYGTITWAGTGGDWTATDAREDETINGKAITIRNGTLTSPTFSDGIGDITVTTQLKFSGSAGNLIVKVNGTTVGTIPYSTAVQTTTISGINIGGNITITITNSNSNRIAIDDVNWTCYTAGPTLIATPSSLSALNYTVGSGPSTVQTFELTGSNLDGTAVNLQVANTDFQISSDNASYSNSISFPAYNGTAKTIYVRLKAGLAVATYTDAVSISGGGVAVIDQPSVAISGAVLAIVAPVIASSSSQAVVYGSAASYQIVASQSPTSYSASGLPTGLSINTTSGLISGTPTVDVGSYTSTINATNAGGTGTLTLTWNITPKPLTISGLSAANKVYDGTASATLSGFGTLTGIVGSDNVLLSGTPTANFANKNVGTAKTVTISGYTLSGTKAGNYSLAQPALTANINAKSLTISGVSANNKVYDGNTNATLSGGTLSGVISPDVVTLSGGGTFASSNAGTGISVTSNLTISGADGGNYTLTQPTGLIANITKVNPVFTSSTITLNVGATYDLPGANVSSTSPGTITYSISSGGNATLAGTTISGVTVGTETLTVTQAASTNYNAGSTTVTVNVNDVANGTYRTTSAGTWPSGTATWERYNGGSWSSATPSASSTDLLIIRHTVNTSGAFSASGGVGTKMTIENGGTFADAHASTFSFLRIKGGGAFDANTSSITFLSTATFQIDDNGTVNINSYITKLWDGIESFSGLSTVKINAWKIDELLFINENSISNHSTTNAKFGKLILQPTTFSGSGSNWTYILPSSGTYTLTHSDFTINNNVVQNFTLNGGDFTVGGNLIANATSSGDIAAQSQTGTKSITVNGNVIKNGTGLFRLNGSGIFTLTVNGDLIINEGTFNSLSVFTSSVYSTVDLKGHFTSASGTTVTASISSNRPNPLYLFSGTINQNIELNGVNNIYNVQINKTSGFVNLITNLTIKESLTMTLGNIVTNSNLLELGETTSNKGTLNYTSGYVVGKMRRWFNGTNSGNATGLYPMGFEDLVVGAGTGLKNRHTKIEFNNAPAAGGHLTVQYIGTPMGLDGIPIPAANTGGAGFDVTTTEDQGYWKIDNEAGKLIGANYTIACTGEGYNTITSLPQLTLLKRVGSGNWFCPGTHLTTTGTIAKPTVSRSGVSDWSNFGFGGSVANPLPVKLTAFSVSCDENQTNISWTTASELNSSHFVVEKSRDLKNWIAVSQTQAAGNSNQMIDYTSHDENGWNGVYYYRLNQIDYNGESEIYGPISVACKSERNAMVVYPNPSNGDFTVEITWSEISTQTQIQIIDLTGKIIQKLDVNLKTGITQIEFDKENLPKGTYLIHLVGEKNMGFKPTRLVIAK